MDEKQLRELLLERLHLEMQLFKDQMLHKEKEDIYSSSYRIEMYINLYEILLQQSERVPARLLRKLLYQPSGILDAFYQEWLGKEDGFYTGLSGYVEDELDILLTAEKVIYGKEDGYGKEQRQNKAA